MTKAEREYMGLLAKRAYDLQLSLGMAIHHVGNVEGGETDSLDDCLERLSDLRKELEDQASE